MQILPAHLGLQEAGNVGLSHVDQFDIFDRDSANSTTSTAGHLVGAIAFALKANLLAPICKTARPFQVWLLEAYSHRTDETWRLNRPASSWQLAKKPNAKRPNLMARSF